MDDKKFKLFGNDTFLNKFVYGLAVAMFAAVIFIYFGAQNISEIPVRTTAIFAVILFFMAVVSYLVSLIIFRRAFVAFVFCIVCWFGFYFLPIIWDALNQYWTFPLKRLVLVSAFMLFSAFIFACIISFLLRRNINKSPSKIIYMFMAVMLIVCVMNCWRLVQVFMYNKNMQAETQNIKLPIKIDFQVDKNSKSPNIYWIHADGMLGISTVEKYFNDKQTKFLEELNKRNFIINPTAKFEARHQTLYAVPVLMNPYSYDNWTHDAIFPVIKKLNDDAFLILRENSEFQYAFAAKNYAVNIIGQYGYYYPIRGGNIWLTDLDQIVPAEDLHNNFILETYNFRNIYLHMITAFLSNKLGLMGESYKAKIDYNKRQEIFKDVYDPDDHRLDFIEPLYDVLHGNYSTPRLTIIHELTPHYIFNRDENGKTRISLNAPLDYHPQHIWSGKVLINVIDMILEVDPDAVIVIQSDHGLHGNTEEEFKKAFGDKADAKELWNSTMSAMRVPQKFQTGEEHYAMETPLNITRYLVNTFVGRNYDYISADIAY